MDAERLKQIERTYHKALEIPPDERDTFFGEFCGEDIELRREVESLLSFKNSSDDLLKTSPESLAAEMFGDEKWHGFIGKQIGHYQIKNLLGRGGMGEVYLAVDLKLERPVALKFLPPEFVANDERMKRFVREAKSLSGLNHPNIITIYEIDEFEGKHFFATEYIDGITLDEYAENNDLNAESALEIAIQIVSALNEAHRAGIIHRDIKPDNIMIRSNGLVKILDFGIVKTARSPIEEENEHPIQKPQSTIHNPGLTSPGMIIGTPNYMSPEQARSLEIDARTDVFSFGVVFYELISGHTPFVGKTTKDTIDAILQKRPKPLDSSVPDKLRRIIEKCLKKNPDERYQTALDLLSDLNDLKQSSSLQNKSGNRSDSFSPAAETKPLKTTTSDKAIRTTNRIISHKPVPSYFFASALAVLLISALGFFGYRYHTAGGQIESIAVMPFVNESGKNDIDYLSDGMTETLIRNLSNVPNLSVKSRSAVFYYKDKKSSPKKIGEELNVKALLLGRILPDEEDLQVNLELVSTETQDVLWSESYRRKQGDLISLQNEILTDLLSKLKKKLAEENEKLTTKSYTTDSEAYKLYLQGRYLWNQRTESGYRQAQTFFQKAIERDPNFALAYVGLADSTAFMYADGEARYKKAETIVRKAIALDNNLGEAHTTLGMIIHNTYSKWAEAEKQYQRAIKLNPNYATSHHWYGELLMQLGRVDEALKHYQKAAEIDPFSMPISSDLGIAYYYAGKTDKAIEQLNKTIRREPTFYRSYFYLARIYEHQEQYEKAIAANQKGHLMANKNADLIARITAGLSRALKESGARGYWKKRLEIYPKLGSEWGCDIVGIHLRLGNKKRAFAELEKAFEEKDFDLIFLQVTPEFDEIRDDPRFQELVRRFGFS